MPKKFKLGMARYPSAILGIGLLLGYYFCCLVFLESKHFCLHDFTDKYRTFEQILFALLPLLLGKLLIDYCSCSCGWHLFDNSRYCQSKIHDHGWRIALLFVIVVILLAGMNVTGIYPPRQDDYHKWQRVEAAILLVYHMLTFKSHLYRKFQWFDFIVWARLIWIATVCDMLKARMTIFPVFGLNLVSCIVALRWEFQMARLLNFFELFGFMPLAVM